MRRSWLTGLLALLCVVIAVCVAALTTRFDYTTDWSAGARATLTAQDQALLAQLKGPLEVTAYARPGPLREKISLLAERFRRFKPDLHLVFVDPDLDPVATQDAGIKADGELVLSRQGRDEHVSALNEAAFADALARLARGGPQLVAFVTGAGEREATSDAPADLGHFVQRLSSQGVRVLPLNLADAAEVPRNASLVVLASPQAALLPSSVKKLEDYVGNGGNLLWLTEPADDDLGLAPLAQALGLRRLPGMLVDPASASGDPRVLVATAYPPQAIITQGFRNNTLFARVVALAARTGAAWDAQPLLQSGVHSWEQANPAPASTAPGADDLKGPLSFGYALTRLSPSPAHNQQRVVVIGDGDFLSNAYLADAGNLAFGTRVVNWLLGDDVLAQLPPTAPDALLKPTRTQLGLLAFVYLVALPILLLLAGAWIGWRRRRR